MNKASSQPLMRGLSGALALPGDKSISHRALMLAAIATGTCHISGLLESGDVLATAEALRQCGASIDKQKNGTWRVIGVGASGLRAPTKALDFGNSGTGARLMMGLVSGNSNHNQKVRFCGDASLSSRPMQRITAPLAKMAVQIDGTQLPLTITPPPHLVPIDYTPPIASAQVKSALLLAGLGARGASIIREAHPTRDHSENMLRLFGAKIECYGEAAHHVVRLEGHTPLRACDIAVAGDPSSAAFAMVAALIVPGSDITLRNMMVNPHRDGLIRILQQMGGKIKISDQRQVAGETIADIHISASTLRPCTTAADIAPAMIDEYPALAIAAACADGTSSMAGLGELRVKESDRLAAIIDGLRANGVNAKAQGDTLYVEGGKPPKGGGMVATHHDHRIAMAFLVLGLAAQNAISVDDITMIATSYPQFINDMKSLGAHFDH